MGAARLKLIVALALTATCASATLAQDHRGRGHLRGGSSAPEDVRVLSDFAQCVAVRQTPEARALLGMDYRSSAYQRELLHLAQHSADCGLAGNLHFSGVLFAGGLAEGLLRARFQPGELATHVALDASRPPIPSRDESEVMNLCVVRSAPAEVAALLRTAPSSAAETLAFRAIVPHLSPCLRAGVRANENRLMLRATLALAAYRLSDYNGFALADVRWPARSSLSDRTRGRSVQFHPAP
jgi:hypothetical protein